MSDPERMISDIHARLSKLETRMSAREQSLETPWPAPICKASRTADPPQDCDWPLCDCDAHARQVISALVECGWGKLEADAANLEDIIDRKDAHIERLQRVIEKLEGRVESLMTVPDETPAAISQVQIDIGCAPGSHAWRTGTQKGDHCVCGALTADSVIESLYRRPVSPTPTRVMGLDGKWHDIIGPAKMPVQPEQFDFLALDRLSIRTGCETELNRQADAELKRRGYSFDAHNQKWVRLDRTAKEKPSSPTQWSHPNVLHKDADCPECGYDGGGHVTVFVSNQIGRRCLECGATWPIDVQPMLAPPAPDGPS